MGANEVTMAAMLNCTVVIDFCHHKFDDDRYYRYYKVVIDNTEILSNSINDESVFFIFKLMTIEAHNNLNLPEEYF